MPDDGAGRYRVSLRRSESSAACPPQEFLTIVRASDAAGARHEAETLVKTLHGDFDILEISRDDAAFRLRSEALIGRRDKRFKGAACRPPFHPARLIAPHSHRSSGIAGQEQPILSPSTPTIISQGVVRH